MAAAARASTCCDTRHANADLLPENTLTLALSVLTGAYLRQSRMTAIAKSPQTGAVGDFSGRRFSPAEMKFAGFDAESCCTAAHRIRSTFDHQWAG